MFANLLAATLASKRGREGCKRIDCDICVGAKYARGSRARCCVLVGVERGSVSTKGWLDDGEVGVDICVVPLSGSRGCEDGEDEGPATGGPKGEGVGFTNIDWVPSPKRPGAEFGGDSGAVVLRDVDGPALGDCGTALCGRDTV